MRATTSLLSLVALSLWGCADKPTPRFTSDSGPPVRDVGAVDAADDVAGNDAYVAVDRPPVQSHRDTVLPGAPPDSPMRFGGPDASDRAPTIVYPSDGTIIPPNLPSFEVHFRPGAGNDLFEIAFEGPVTVARFYTRCMPVGGGCVATLNAAQMEDVAAVSTASSDLWLTVRGTNMVTPGSPVGRSVRQRLGVTQTPLRGGVYYWASSGSIVRYEFGAADARPELFLRGGLIDCVGCHALSRDGSRIAAGRFIPAPAPTQIVDVMTRNNVGASFGSNFGTFSPDNQRYLSSDGARLALLDANTGMTAPGLPDGTLGSMPDWSPNGDQVVFARSRSGAPLLGGQPGHTAPADLMLMAWSSGAFATPTSLLHSDGPNMYYPSFSPDALWVVFNESPGESYNNVDAQLWAVRSMGGTPVRLQRAEGPDPGMRNSWPKWTPFVERYVGEVSEPLMWVTFSSARDYGLRLRQTSMNRTSQLWMAAFRPNGTGDPSSPAFWLPFQDITQGNHIAQWVASVRRQDCGDAGACAMGETCIRGRCIGAPP